MPGAVPRTITTSPALRGTAFKPANIPGSSCDHSTLPTGVLDWLDQFPILLESFEDESILELLLISQIPIKALDPVGPPLHDCPEEWHLRNRDKYSVRSDPAPYHLVAEPVACAYRRTHS